MCGLARSAPPRLLGDGIALSFLTSYEQAFNHGAQVDGDPNQFGFGPIAELAKGPFLLTLNPLFTKGKTFAFDGSTKAFSWIIDHAGINPRRDWVS